MYFYVKKIKCMNNHLVFQILAMKMYEYWYIGFYCYVKEDPCYAAMEVKNTIIKELNDQNKTR